MNDTFPTREEIYTGRRQPDPLYIKSWELAVQMVEQSTKIPYQSISNFPEDRTYAQTVKEWQAYFYEQLKGGTDGK